MKWEQRGTSRKGKHRQKSRQGNRYGQKPIINVLPLPSDHYNHNHKTDLRHRAVFSGYGRIRMMKKGAVANIYSTINITS